jgi:hypothetical protein
MKSADWSIPSQPMDAAIISAQLGMCMIKAKML